MTRTAAVRTLWSLVVSIGVLTPVAAAGQQASAERQGPPVVRFTPDGLTLEEAVRLALDNDAELARAQADLDRRRGVLQEQQGPFDLTLLGNVSFSYRIQEMTESRKAEERKKREDLDKSIAQQETGLKELTDTQALVTRLRANPTDSAALSQLTILSPTLSATLQTLNQLIASSSGALQAQYIGIRNDVLNSTFTTGNDVISQATTDLNNTKKRRADIGDPPIDEYFTDITYQMQLSKLFRSGVSVSPFFDSAFSSTGFVGKPHQKEFGGKGLTDLYTFHAGTQAFVPLGRGRGRAAVGAFERAAERDVAAAEQTLAHQASVTALNTIQAYWQLRAAQEAAEIAGQSVQFQNQLVQLTQGRAADLPGAELARARAAQARATAGQLEAQTAFRDARVALAVAMGIAVTEDDATLPTRARDPFPAAPAGTALTTAPVAAYQQAATGREDVAAARNAIEASQALVEGARLNLKSVLDLSLGTWYTALDEGDGGKALDRWVGPSVSAAISYERPFGNNRQQGQLAQREAELRQSQIEQEDLARRIRLSVAQSVSTLQETATRVQQNDLAVSTFQTTITAQMQRLRDGAANVTVIDTIITEQEQLDMLLALVAARADLARQIADLRYRTGTLVDGRNVRPADLVTIPTTLP
jgi:outer membrane protein TolC